MLSAGCGLCRFVFAGGLIGNPLFGPIRAAEAENAVLCSRRNLPFL